MYPTGKVARTIGQDRIFRQMLLQRRHDGRHVDVAGQSLRCHIGQIVRVTGLRPVLPGQRCRRLQFLQRVRRSTHTGVDRQISLVDAIQFFSAGMNVHQLLFRPRCFQQRVATGRHLTEPRTNGQNQVTVLDARGQLGVDANAHITGIQRVVVVESVLKPERVAHRQHPALGKALQRLRRLDRPTTATGDHKRPLGLQQHLAQCLQRSRVAPGLNSLDPGQRLRQSSGDCVGHHGLHQHVLRQHQHHRSGSAVHGGGKGARHVLGDAPCVVDALHTFRKALGAGSEETLEVHFLKRFPVPHVTGHIADKQHHRRRILKRRVHANRCVGGTGAARHKADTGAPGEPSLRIGHEGRTTLLPVDDEADLVAIAVKAVQHSQVAFTGHAKSMRHALLNQALNQQVAGDLGGSRSTHSQHCAETA